MKGIFDAPVIFSVKFEDLIRKGFTYKITKLSHILKDYDAYTVSVYSPQGLAVCCCAHTRGAEKIEIRALDLVFFLEDLGIREFTKHGVVFFWDAETNSAFQAQRRKLQPRLTEE